MHCSPACSIEQVDETLLDMLDAARDIAGIPFVINSAYRSVSYERKHGRSGSSAHCLGLAVDIRCVDSLSRYRIIHALLAVGFKRIGIYSRFIHVDIADSSKPSPVVFVLDEH